MSLNYMPILIICIGILLMILERIFPDQNLPDVKGWWKRVIILNFFQLLVVILGKYTWDNWFSNFSFFDLDSKFPTIISGFLTYFIITFVFYWWHRWRHTINALWLVFHQVHHSPQRIETVTSFYKHPLEIIVNSIIIGFINFYVFGLNLESAQYTLLFASLGEYFYHMNIKTPHWVGYFFQRPEMHRIHHEQGKHFNNFSDFPIWDMLFGTYLNPKKMYEKCGYKTEREIQLKKMLLFKNVNNPFK